MSTLHTKVATLHGVKMNKIIASTTGEDQSNPSKERIDFMEATFEGNVKNITDDAIYMVNIYYN